MGFRFRRYQCPSCEKTFDFLHEVTDGVEEPPPDYCPKCGEYVGSNPEPIPHIGALLKPQNQTMDRVYRQMESASIARAEQAADMMGVPVSEMSNIKMLDMKDNLREGDISAKIPTPTPVPQAPPQNLMNGNAGLATAAMIKSQGGSVGQSVMDGFRRDHHMRANQMMRLGEMGRAKANS